jgi:hypothetical protein
MVKPEQIEKIKQFIINNNCLYFEIIDSKNKSVVFDYASNNVDEIASEIDDYLSLFADGTSIDVIVYANQKSKTKGKTFLIHNHISGNPISVNAGNPDLLVKYALLEQSIQHEKQLREKDSIISGFSDPDDEEEDDEEEIEWYNREEFKPYKDAFVQNPIGFSKMIITEIVSAFNGNQVINTNHSISGIEDSQLLDEYLKIDPDGIKVLKAIINLAKNKPNQYKTYKPLLLGL